MGGILLALLPPPSHTSVAKGDGGQSHPHPTPESLSLGGAACALTTDEPSLHLLPLTELGPYSRELLSASSFLFL